jgi:hypothetical protein
MMKTIVLMTMASGVTVFSLAAETEAERNLKPFPPAKQG